MVACEQALSWGQAEKGPGCEARRRGGERGEPPCLHPLPSFHKARFARRVIFSLPGLGGLFTG